jgi:hypothetical protein
MASERCDGFPENRLGPSVQALGCQIAAFYTDGAPVSRLDWTQSGFAGGHSAPAHGAA